MQIQTWSNFPSENNEQQIYSSYRLLDKDYLDWLSLVFILK